MRIIHLSDLHLGKRISDYPMDDDQEYILKEILGIIKDEKADAVVIAGDIYDKGIPPEKAVAIFDKFLTELKNRNVPTLVITGNHDSAERVSFGNRIMESSNIYISSVYKGNVKKVTLKDEYGPVNFYLLPFIKPSDVKNFYKDEKIDDFTDAMRVAISHMDVDTKERNVLVCHQFVTGATVGGSEESITVGTLDNINASVFDDFDYVALGHIHGPQNVGGDPRICYCGTPLKYSFSEVNHKKGVKVVDFFEKGKCEHKYVPLVPLHDMRELRGTFAELIAEKNWKDTKTDDYIHITLTDEEDVINGQPQLQSIYKNLMKFDYDNKRTRNENNMDDFKAALDLTPKELIEKFFKFRNDRDMTEQEKKYMDSFVEELWEGKH